MPNGWDYNSLACNKIRISDNQLTWPTAVDKWFLWKIFWKIRETMPLLTLMAEKLVDFNANGE